MPCAIDGISVPIFELATKSFADIFAQSSNLLMSAPSRTGPPLESSEASWEAPPGKMSREVSQPDYETGPEYGGNGPEDSSPEHSSPEVSSADYRTGNDYRALGDGEDEISYGGQKLEGDGLDALEPDLERLPSKTGNLPANYDGDAEGEDGHGGSALLGRKALEQDGLGERLKCSAASALDNAGDEHEGERGGGSAEK